MAAAVAHRSSPRVASSSSRTSSPIDNKKSVLKSDDTSRKSSPLVSKSTLPETQAVKHLDDSKPVIQASEPLAPPPRPAQSNQTNTPDYFSGLHNGGTHFSLEPNPFEQSFGAPSAETPGKSLLPPVAALASPAIPGTNSSVGFNWQNSLRSGPLSPAMLAGPAGSTGDYFDSIGRGFPTPNESSLRTGLTPGGGGSMFPAPSPNAQALFQQMQSGGATPGTLEFHRTAMNAAARTKSSQFTQTSNPQESIPQNMEQKQQNDPFAQHDATDAANGLFMLAKGGQQPTPFAVPNQPVQPQPIQAKPAQAAQEQTKRGARHGGSLGSMSGADMSGSVESPESHEETSRPATRGGRGKKTAKAQTTAATPSTNGRRKQDDMPKSSNKRTKSNTGAPMVDPTLELPDEDDSDEEEEQTHENGKKMTDDEKRRNFLERNRVAALKCRQRKKQWLANLQAKVEMYSAENDTLNSQVAQLHEEIRNLRTLLMGHKDCPVGHAQGIGAFLNGMGDGPAGFANQHVNPYGMAMTNGAGMQRS